MIQKGLLITACVLHSSDDKFKAPNCEGKIWSPKTIQNIREHANRFRFDVNHGKDKTVVKEVYLMRSWINQESMSLANQYINNQSWLIQFVLLNEMTNSNIQDKKINGVSIDIASLKTAPCNCNKNHACKANGCHDIPFISLVEKPCNFLRFEYEVVEVEI
nr:XkdF-like putative serine protease domain-containing protein [Methanobrevibacter arboriphilus]